MRNSVVDLAQGRWVEILSSVGGIPVSYLDNKHKPCPSCRDGDDRFRFDDQDGNGTWFCSHCGGKDGMGGGGTGMSLLMRVTGMEFKEAARAVEDYLGIERPTRKSVTAKHPVKPPVDAAPPALDGASHQWCYTDAAGEPLFWIQRITRPDGSKLFRPRTWVAGTGWQGASGTSWPTPRPLYNLAALHARPTAQVIVCEGEKAADCAQELFPQLVAVSWPNGAQSVAKVDWSPLAGRSILLWPDNDDQGRDAMQRIAGLIRDPVKLLTIDAPPDAPEKWDIADADWTSAEALAYIKANHRPMELPEPEVVNELVEITETPAKDPRKPSRRQAGQLDGMPFRCLGFDRSIYFYLPEKAGQVVALTPAQHSKNYLLTLAPLERWVTMYGTPTKSGEVQVDWTSAADTLIDSCTQAGVYDPARVRGRGAWADASRVILHLGNRLVINGHSHLITKLPSDFKSYYFYENAKPIEGPGDEALSDDHSKRIKDIAQGFRWEATASANLLLGWIVLAPVCGSLDWRPHIWVTGPAGSGKTSLLKLFMKPLLGAMYEGATGGTTEAGLRGQLRSDAIPIVFDELEQNEQKDKQQVQNILALARIASSEGGKIYKGTTNGGVNTFEIRSMFCVSSINVALVQRADLDRFCVLSLRKGDVSKDDWDEFEKKILQTCTEETGRQLAARTLKQIPVIRKNAKTLAAALASKFGQRFGDQYGTLLAGTWSLEPNGGGELTLDKAKEWIDSMDWKNREVDANDADERKCLTHILQAMVPVESGRRMTLLELVQMADQGVIFVQPGSADRPGEEVATVLGRYGLKVSGKCLAISNTSTALQSLLRDTPWAGNAYRQALRRLPGATPSSATVRFAASGISRATLVPLETVETDEAT
jgi:putative DNA primase/helicase